MAHEVFISYSSQDKAIADAVTARLESHKIRCWIAPRDILPGQPYAASLIDAIQKAKVFVLILSSKSNQSKHVMREVSEAVETGIPIIPFRIDDVQPSTEMRYYIKSLHWLDAITPPLERTIDVLAKNIHALLDEPQDEIPVEVVETTLKKPKKIPVLLIGIIPLAIIILLFVLFFDQLTSSGIKFSTYNNNQWEKIGSASFIGKSQNEFNALLRSDDQIEGDFTLTFSATLLKDPLTREPGSVGLFIYGDGSDMSDQSLFVSFGNGYSNVWRKNPYESENEIWSILGPKFENDKKYDVIIKVDDKLLKVSVDGSDIITFNIPEGFTRKGYITFWKYHASNSIKFENIKIR
jgi:hypothetical protein